MTVVNYDNFSITPELMDGYSAMVRGLVDQFYLHVTRYTASAFLRARLGDALNQQEIQSNLFPDSDAALSRLHDAADPESGPPSRAA